MTKRTDRVRAAIRDLQARGPAFEAEAAGVMADRDRSPEWKKRRLLEVQDQHEASAASYAIQARKQALADLEKARDDLRAAHAAKLGSVDYARRQWLLETMRAELTAPPDVLRGDATPAKRVARLYAEAKEGDDRDALAALRVAAAPVLEAALSISDSGDAEASALAAGLKRHMAEDAAAEDAGVVAARAEVGEMQQVIADLDAVILQTETTLTGRSKGWADAPTAWSTAILGEQPRIGPAVALTVS